MNHRETMLKTNNSDCLNKKANELVSRKIWPQPRVQDQEECSRGQLTRQMINRPGQPRLRTLLRADRSDIFEGTVDKNDRESFHCAMGSILYAAQYFGILPLVGVRSESPRKIAFKIYSVSSVYAVAMMIMLFFMAVISVGHMIQTLRTDTVGGITRATAGVMFYINSLLGTVLFMWLAPRWISLQRDWRAMERFLDRDKHQTPRLRWKFSMLTAAIMITALLEHALAVVNLIPREFWSSASNMTVGNAFQFIGEISHPYIFTICSYIWVIPRIFIYPFGIEFLFRQKFSQSVCNYNVGIGIFIFSINGIGTFTWNFTDLFVMLISEGLAVRYKSLNRRVKDTIIAYRGNVDWRHLRESYATLSTLVKTVDNNISPIILLSFVNNLYYVCRQLLNSISPQRDVLATIYFLVSFATLLGRTIAVTLLAAQINDDSRNALPDLYNCPGPAYNIETQRLQEQLSTERVSLTGMGFFSITRSFMLAVSSTIVTYEIMLLNATSE